MGKGWILLLLLGVVSSFGNSGKISLDASGIVDLTNQLKIYTYHVLSYLDHLATNTMKLKLSPKALQKFKFFQNVTRAGISFEGLTDVPNYKAIAEKALNKLEANLSDESIFLIKALSSKNLNIPMAFKPTDETLQETMNFMDALKKYWRYVDQVTALEVEELDPFNVAANLKETFLNRTKNYKMDIDRDSRSYLIPDLPLQVSEKNIEYLLTKIFINPRGFESEEGVLEKSFIRSFITKTFEELNLIVLNHEFSVHENDYEYNKEILGMNIVGLLPGERWGTSEDEPLLVGAHYDTMPNTTGTIDNASGTTAVLEVARILTSSKCQFKNSIFFVAFDLEEIGIQGSFMFVKDFLLKILFPTFGIQSFGGALILDCVANWDPNSDTQEVPDTWEEKVQGFKLRMDNRERKGDFVAIIYRKNPDNELAGKFNYYYSNLKKPKFRLELMPLNELEESRPNTTVNMENFDFFRSDHYRFWYPSEEAPSISLPALLITDTAPYRGKMKQCYHNYCDTVETIQPNFEFLGKISTASAWVIADLAIGSCGLFSIPELFQVTKDNTHTEGGTNKYKNRPSITPEGVMDILKYLGNVRTNNFKKSINEIELQSSNSPSLLKAPLHRFTVPTKSLINETSQAISPFNHVTITIHGDNSTFLIPIVVDYSQAKNKNIKKLEPISSSATDDQQIIPSFEINNETHSLQINLNNTSSESMINSDYNSTPTTTEDKILNDHISSSLKEVKDNPDLSNIINKRSEQSNSSLVIESTKDEIILKESNIDSNNHKNQYLLNSSNISTTTKAAAATTAATTTATTTTATTTTTSTEDSTTPTQPTKDLKISSNESSESKNILSKSSTIKPSPI